MLMRLLVQIAIVATFLALVLYLGYFAYCLSRGLWPSRRIVIGDITRGKQKDDVLPVMFHERWLRLERSHKHPGSPCNFVEDLNIVGRPVLDQAGRGLDIGEFELKIKGVDVGAVIKLLDALATRPPYRNIAGDVTIEGSECVLAFSVRERNKALRSWRLSAKCPSDPGAQSAVLDRLMDEAIIELSAFLEPSGTAEDRSNEMSPDPDHLSVEAQVALGKGRIYLDRYFESHDRADLQQAQEHFLDLTRRAPGYADAYLLRGLALAEDRQEDDAILMFERAEEELCKRLTTDSGAKEKVWNARLLIGKSRMRLYTWGATCAAVTKLRALKDELAAPEGAPALLKAQTYTELAHCYGHLMVHLWKEDLASAQNDLRSLGLQIPAGGVRTRAELIPIIYDAHKASLAEASKIDLGDDPLSVGAKARVCEAEGYALFRKAEWLPPREDDRFRRDCDNALLALKRAKVDNPASYALLQNIGTIYMSRRYDPEGDHLDAACRLFRRSAELKPTDYFAYEKMALIELRRALRATAPSEQADHVKAGVEHVKRGLECREESGHLPIIRLALLVVRALAAEQPSSDQAREVELAFRGIERRRKTEHRERMFEWLRIAWWVYRLGSADEKDFDTQAALLIGSLERLKSSSAAARDEDWIARDLSKEAERVAVEVAEALRAKDPAERKARCRKIDVPIEAVLE